MRRRCPKMLVSVLPSDAHPARLQARHAIDTSDVTPGGSRGGQAVGAHEASTKAAGVGLPGFLRR